MGAVAPFGGKIIVTTRGSSLELIVDTISGDTRIIRQEQNFDIIGTRVELSFPHPMFSATDFDFARAAITVAKYGEIYNGPSEPSRETHSRCAHYSGR